MRVLLDTTYLYRFMEATAALTENDRRFFGARELQLYASAVSIWEMRLKHNARHASGERKSRFDPDDVIPLLENQGVTFLPMTIRHAARALETPLGHRDPFDELLLVQAQEEGLKLLTVDRLLVSHPLAVSSQDAGP
ncbi:MAG: type II toxin-antitoxin system VapC family toxin [Alphaproteobacteria bacterium]|nr:type II toxin-antitoxin system VapC family toxin [Alphaproteobacteria bacterium]MYE59659.1 type II toxin-antitoxin system VapC family toxin [Alphaproteobacteria bacterium]